MQLVSAFGERQKLNRRKGDNAMKNLTQKFATVSLMLLAAVLTAGAQSEVSPDHFDDQPSAAAAQASTTQPSEAVKAQIATEEARLNGYEAQINEKERQVKSDWEAATTTAPGDEAGQMIAYTIHEKECEQLKADLAPQIREARETLASLRNGSTTVAQAGRAGKQDRMLVATVHRTR